MRNMALGLVLALGLLGMLACSEDAPLATQPPADATALAPTVAEEPPPPPTPVTATATVPSQASPLPPTHTAPMPPAPTLGPAATPTRTPEPTPTPAPTSTAVPTATPSPTATPTPTPKPSPTPTPTPSPTPTPNATPTPPPTPTPTPSPTPAPTPAPPKPTRTPAPRVTPPPAAEAEPLPYVPSLNARVTGLRFFEQEFDPYLPSDARVYKKTFSHQTTRVVGWEVRLAYPPQPERIKYEIEAVYYRPDGTVFSRRSLDSYVDAGWTGSRRSWRTGVAVASTVADRLVQVRTVHR